MKKLNKLMLMLAVITALLCGFALQGSAATFSGSCGESVTWSIDAETKVLTITGTGAMNDSYFSPWAYSYDGYVKSVVIEDGVTTIGKSAFLNCSDITDVTIPSSVISIGEEAFDSCDSLTSITIPSSVKSIGNCAFQDCKSLTSVTIPDGIESIGKFAFDGCTALSGVTIPSSVTNIEGFLFRNCDSLTEITIPSSVTSIESGAFSECDGLTSITIPSSVTYIEEYAFSSCQSLTSISVAPENTVYTDIDGVLCNKDKTTLLAFPAGKPQTSYTIPDSITSIVYYAFCGCKVLTDIVIHNGFTKLDDYAFYDCDGLTSITVPSSVTSIGHYAFYDCDGLTSITIPSGVTTIGEAAFGYCDSLTEVEIPGTVTTIDKYAFDLCSALTSVVIPTGVTAIEEGAFNSCDSLMYVFYAGTKAQWNKIQIHPFNASLTSALIHCNSTDHNWNEGTVIKAATCTADGSKTCECTYTGCDEIVTQAIPKKGHTLTTLKAKAATCTETGLTEGKKCSVCGEVTVAQKTIAQKGHTLTTLKAKAATCTQAGLTEGKKCSVCGVVTVAQKTIAKKAHTEVTVKGKAATCTATGKTDGKKCSVCGTVTKAQTAIAKKAHTNKTTTAKATTSKDGSITEKCTVCGKVKSKTVIYKVSMIELSTVEYSYDGKIRNPAVYVKDSSGKTLKRNIDYTVDYPSGRSSVGTYKVTVSFKGNYSGKKTLSFIILPRTTNGIKITQTTTSIKATWTKVSGVTGYKVSLYKGSKLVESKTVGSGTTSYTFKKLTAGTSYTVKVKTYKTVKNVNYWSREEPLGTATKPATPSVKSVKAGSKSATVKWSNVSGENGYQVYYATSKNGSYKKGATTKANDIDATIKSLTKGKTYYFKVRAYKTADSGTVYSAWSAVKSVKVK